MDFLNTVNDFMSGGGGKAINSLMGLAGAGSNIYTGIQSGIQNQKIAAAQDYVRSLVQNPAKMAAAAAGYTAPLTAGLESGISNEVQANLAERGLGSSPAAYTQQLTQALAPYIQQNSATGYQNLFTALGLDTNMRNPYASVPMNNLAGLLKQLQLPGQPGQSPGVLDPNAGSDPLGLNDLPPPPVTLPTDPTSPGYLFAPSSILDWGGGD